MRRRSLGRKLCRRAVGNGPAQSGFRPIELPSSQHLCPVEARSAAVSSRIARPTSWPLPSGPRTPLGGGGREQRQRRQEQKKPRERGGRPEIGEGLTGHNFHLRYLTSERPVRRNAPPRNAARPSYGLTTPFLRLPKWGTPSPSRGRLVHTAVSRGTLPAERT